jgi:ATP-dependent exoDNAse (exonuclease V) beta subunit
MSLSVARKRKKDKQSNYYWLLQTVDTEEEGAIAIQNVWKRLGDAASSYGTKCHLQCELYLNDVLKDSDPEICTHALEAIRWMRKKIEIDDWVPFRTEYSVFIDMNHAKDDEDGCYVENHNAILAGQIDSLWKIPNGDFVMLDFKFTGSDKLNERDGEYNGVLEMGKPPLHEIPNNSFGHYQIQQNLYAYILKRRYNIHVKQLLLLHVPTDTESPRARAVPLPFMDDETIEKMFCTF